jgi:hypothetical protein
VNNGERKEQIILESIKKQNHRIIKHLQIITPNVNELNSPIKRRMVEG